MKISNTISFPLPELESERLHELFSYKILDTPIENEFEDMIKIATRTFNVPVAAITFIDAERQWVKASVGLNFCELDRGISICDYSILQSAATVIEDLTADRRFSHFPYVCGAPFFKFYAGFPLVTKNGFHIGVLCLLDTEVRKLSEEDKLIGHAFARTAMAQVEARLRNTELEKLNDMHKRISSTLSHDIRNPLSYIKMMLDMQDGDTPSFGPAEQKQLYKLLKGQVNNTLDMLTNLIQWGKLEMGGDAEKLQYADVTQLIHETIQEIEIQAGLKNNKFAVHMPEQAFLQLDCQGFRFVLRNLLSNANKFTENGCISVSCFKAGSKTYISVADTGVGMDKQQVQQLNNNKTGQYGSGTRNEKGNGLGLGLVIEYLAKQNSSLVFESALDKGTTVLFSL